MIELARRFIGKECLIYAFDSNHQFEGVIKEVTDGAILIEKEEKLEEESRHNDQILQDKPHVRRMPESPAPV